MDKTTSSDHLNGLLDIPELEVIDLTEDNNTGDYAFHTVIKHPTTECAFCKKNSIVKNGKYHRFLRDINIRGHRVGILVTGTRYYCRICHRSFVDRLLCAGESDKTTLRLKEYITAESLKKPFLQIEKELDIKSTTIKRYFKEYVADKEKDYVRYSPDVLGIDEAHLSKGMRGVIVDGTQHNVIELLPDRKIDTIKKYFSSLPEPNNIKVVTMDMWRPYKEAVNECLPYASIVIDKFHVIKEMHDLLNKYKNEVLAQKRPCRIKNSKIKYLISYKASNLSVEQIEELSAVFDAYPELETAYGVKEAFHEIYDCNDRASALNAYDNWKAAFPSELNTMRPIIGTVENWRQEIFNYFDYNYTNAITESLNGLIKHLERAGRGYSFDVLRAKVLFGKAAVKPKYVYNKGRSLGLFKQSYMHTSMFKPKLLYGSGANIYMLQSLLDNDDL